MRRRPLILMLAGALALLAVSPATNEAVPPNPKDPCANNGRDTCGTTGVGFYKTYRYGQRWFGDFQ